MITVIKGEFSYYSARLQASRMYEEGMITRQDYGWYLFLLDAWMLHKGE